MPGLEAKGRPFCSGVIAGYPPQLGLRMTFNSLTASGGMGPIVDIVQVDTMPILHMTQPGSQTVECLRTTNNTTEAMLCRFHR